MGVLDPPPPVRSVNNKRGAVAIDWTDVGADQAGSAAFVAGLLSTQITAEATARGNADTAEATARANADTALAAEATALAAPAGRSTTLGLVTNSTGLVAGMIVRTQGFHTVGDGRADTWRVETATGSETWVSTGLGFSVDAAGHVQIAGGKRLTHVGDRVSGAAFGMLSGSTNTALLQALVTYAASRGMVLDLPPGAYDTDEVSVPSGSVIRGNGTTLHLLSGGTRAVFAIVGTSVTNKTDVTIESITFTGNLPAGDAQALGAPSGTQVGVYYEEATRVAVRNCRFIDFGAAAIKSYYCSYNTSTRPGNLIQGCFASNCGIGWWMARRAEYTKVVGAATHRCGTGAWVTGGNNNFVACHFDENRTGFYVDEIENSSHGAAVGCSFNHCSSYAVNCTGVRYGFLFTGCHIWAGNVLVRDSQAVRFDACIMGNTVEIRLQGVYAGGGRNVFADCLIAGTGGVTVVHDYSGSTDNTIVEPSCQKQDGTLLDPTSVLNAQTGTAYAPVLRDEGRLVTLANGAAISVTLPSDATLPFPIGKRIDFQWTGVGQPSFVAGGSAVVNSPGGALKISARYGIVSAQKVAANTWNLVGSLSV